MPKRPSPHGPTTPSQFRLSDQTLAELDVLVQDWAAETGEHGTRTSVIRQLIRQAYLRRGRRKKS